jgi:hypothetical protein
LWGAGGGKQKVSDLCIMVLFNFDLGLLAIQVTASIISTSEFDHGHTEKKNWHRNLYCKARGSVVAFYAVQSDL